MVNDTEHAALVAMIKTYNVGGVADALASICRERSRDAAYVVDVATERAWLTEARAFAKISERTMI